MRRHPGSGKIISVYPLRFFVQNLILLTMELGLSTMILRESAVWSGRGYITEEVARRQRESSNQFFLTRLCEEEAFHATLG
jgi:hypothetical protein